MSIIDRGPFRRKGVDEYIKRMSQPREKSVYDSTVTSMLVKAGYAIPEDPASIYNPDQLWEQLERYAEPVSFKEDEFIKSAISRAYRVFGKRNSFDDLRPLSLESELYKAIKLDKHAGVYFDSKLASWNRAWTRSSDVVNGIKSPNPCLAGVRTQRGNKTRLVWGYPLEMTILEAKFARPLIEKFKLIRSPMPYALRRHEIGARLEFSMRGRNRVALDFSKFDSSVSPALIRAAFRILKTWFYMTDEDEKTWKLLVNYFISTPIVMIDGHLYTGKKKGVPSGSYFTQLIDSIVNYIIITAAMLKFDLKPHEKQIHVLGDDSVFATNKDVNLTELATYFRMKGFTLNVDKSEVVSSTEPIHFIGFDWYKGTPNRDFNKMILSMTQPEKWRKREVSFKAEQARAYRLILEMSTLGSNMYEIVRQVMPQISPRNHLFLSPEGNGLTDYMKYVFSENKPNYWRNIATGMWI